MFIFLVIAWKKEICDLLPPPQEFLISLHAPLDFPLPSIASNLGPTSQPVIWVR